MSNKLKKIASPKNLRETILVLTDAICITLVYLATVLLINYRSANSELVINCLVIFPLLLGLCFFIMLVVGVLKYIWRYASLGEYVKLSASIVVAVAIFSLLDYFLIKKISNISIYVALAINIPTSLIIMRAIYSLLYNKMRATIGGYGAISTMVIGAGYTGKMVVDELLRHKSQMKPVCIVDDDSDKRGRSIASVKIVGNTSEIAKYVKKFDIKKIIFAIPSCDEENRKRILKNCVSTECEIKVLPFLGQMIQNVNIMSQAKEIRIEDLLGRPPIMFDCNEITAYVQNKNCLVTGGGGSIGSELLRQIAKYKPKKLVILDIYENSAYDIQQELIREFGENLNLATEICSVSDFDRMKLLYKTHKFDIIFHAAAHKHVPLMETNPEEAIKNNVLGTYNIAKLAGEEGVQKLILISTDKAVNPTNVMGASKRCCEMVIQHFSKIYKKTEYAAVRFGNVLGSNGSVIPLFKEQIKKGGPITVTHRDIIRYFMTIPEAVSLVLQAGGYAKRGEVFVLDMGEPVRIVELAENLIRMMGYVPYEDIDIVFTGLRPGEKLFEEVLTDEEGLEKTSNAKIYVGHQNVSADKNFEGRLKNLINVAFENNIENVLVELKAFVPTFNHQPHNRKTSISNINEMLELQNEINKARERKTNSGAQL